jgi:transcriptional regulator with PAS, ATPase and Fis domain
MIIKNTNRKIILKYTDLPSYIEEEIKDENYIINNNDLPILNSQLNLKRIETIAIKEALKLTDNKSEVARKLGISRDKLYRIMRKYNIK